MLWHSLHVDTITAELLFAGTAERWAAASRGNKRFGMIWPGR